MCDEAVLFYPLYALRFADAGLSPAAVSSLFVIWSVTGFVLEIPTGAWADTVSRRRLLAGSALLRGLGFGLWTVWPTYPGFALGFLLWGAHGAVRSGALEALLHDDLAAAGRADRYLAVTGRAQAWATGAMVAATALAGPALAAGGYPLVGAASVAVCVLGALVCLRLPEAPRRVVGPAPDPLAPAGEDPAAGALRGYLAAVRSGVREAATRHGVRRAVLLAALVPGFSALDEYLPLLARADGVSTAWVPALLLLPTAAMAVGGAWAGRRGGTGDRLGPALLLGAVLLAAGASVRHPAGMLPVAGFFGIVQWGQLVAEARLQATITGPARATVLSVAGLGWEVCALAVYAGFALGDRVAAPPALMAVAALAVALTAGYAGRVARGPDRPDRPVPAVAGAPDRVA